MNETVPESFECQQLKRYAHEALLQLAPIYLGDEAASLNVALTCEVLPDTHDAEAVPLTRYDNRSKQLSMRIAPEVTLDYAETLKDDVNHDVETADIAKVLVGAGIARCIVGWKASRSQLASEKQQQKYKELLCDKSYLWELSDRFDDENNTNIRQAVERLGDAQIIRVNILRFALGASLVHLCDSTQLQQNMVHHMQQELIEIEAQRRANLNFNLGWLDPKNAFAIHDDTTPELELAFSFPMTPAEGLQSFAA